MQWDWGYGKGQPGEMDPVCCYHKPQYGLRYCTGIHQGIQCKGYEYDVWCHLVEYNQLDLLNDLHNVLVHQDVVLPNTLRPVPYALPPHQRILEVLDHRLVDLRTIEMVEEGDRTMRKGQNQPRSAQVMCID